MARLDEFHPVVAAHWHAAHHRGALAASEQAGCFYCLSVFAPAEVVEWIDDDDTALCPHCGIDAVLPSKAGYPMTREFLEQMQRHWF